MIAILGAGPCGLYVASRLHAQGRKVRVFTACRPAFRFETKALKPWMQGTGVGGRAQLWGGWTGFPTRAEFLREKWPISQRRLREGLVGVQEWLEIEPSPLSEEFLRLGFQPRQQARRSWKRWPFPIHRNMRALKLVEDDHRVTGFVAKNERTGKTSLIPADEIILCTSPFSTLSLLGNLSTPPPGLGRGISNHMVAGWIGIQPRQGRPRAPAFGWRKVPHGVLELKGPFSAQELDPSWGDHEFYRIHFLGRAGPKDLRVRNFRVSGRWSWNAAERARARSWDRRLPKILKSLSPGLRCFRIQNPLHPTQIAHESGGAAVGTTLGMDGGVFGWENLYVMDASALPTGLDLWPTLPLLTLLETFLRARGAPGAPRKSG